MIVTTVTTGATIEDTAFGSIVIDGVSHRGDVVVRLSGRVEERRKELSRRHGGNSHTVSEDEMRDLAEDGCETVVIGTGQAGALCISAAAEAFLAERGVCLLTAPTPQAIRLYSRATAAKVGLFHVNC